MVILLLENSSMDILSLPDGTFVPAVGDTLQLMGKVNGNIDAKVVGRTFAADVPAPVKGIDKPLQRLMA